MEKTGKTRGSWETEREKCTGNSAKQHKRGNLSVN